MISVLLVLLGCNINYILDDRITTAITYSSMYNNTNISWFLSGGIKNKDESNISEADIMKEKISAFYDNNNNTSNNTISYVLDTLSTNTAENFIELSIYLKKEMYNNVYIVTSKYHYNRALKIMDKIIIDNNFKWILSNKYMRDSNYWERIHIKNVDTDVEKALKKYPI